MFCPVCRADYPADYKVCPKDAIHLLASPRIGKYQIDALIGIGGMGAVYSAVNPDTRARVAIKLMNPNVASAESARARFQREAAAVAALRTTHVVKVYDFGTETDGTLYLVMELLDGHALRDEILPAPARMDLARVQMVMDGALKGLAAAHRAGIVHRDLKPDNVFVADTDDGEVPKLLDFGIARVTTSDSDLTRTGALMGTAAYMAVEQVSTGSIEVGPWSDVYAMGTILYEMLTGTPAYGGGTLTDVLHRVMKADVAPLATIRPGLSAAIYDLVERCTSLDASRRPQDAEAMRSALTAAQLVPPGTAIPPPTLSSADRAQLGTAPTEGRDSSPSALAATALSGSAVSATPYGDTVAANHDATALMRPARAAKATGTPGDAAAPAITTLASRASRSSSPPPPPTTLRRTWPLLVGVLVLAGVGGVIAVRMLRAPGDGLPSAPPLPASNASPVEPSVISVTASRDMTGAATETVDSPVDASAIAVPTEPTTAVTRPEPCDAKAFREAARAANKARSFKKAIELASKGLTCGGNEPGLHSAIVFAACKLGDDALVMKHHYSQSRLRIEATRTICARYRKLSP